MKGYIRCVATVFGDYNNLQFGSSQIMKIMQDLNQFEVIPSVQDEFVLEIKNNIPSQRLIKRVQFISEKGKLRVAIGGSNIAIEANIAIDESQNLSETNINEFLDNAKKIFSTIYKIIEKKGNRAAFVISFLDEDDCHKFENFSTPNDYFKGKNIFEWNVRSVIREPAKICGRDEVVNVVSSIERAKGIVGTPTPFPKNYEFDGTVFEIDINTIPENIENRIDDKFLNEFYDYALSLKSELLGS